ERARDVFQRRLDLLIPQTLWVSERPPIRLRAMQTQWGNCSAKGCLTLNPWLVKASSECIDYVLLHELCHVAEHNHSEEFYRLMGQVMPGWEKVKKRLDGMAGMLLADM
ncbi:TPA: M48 family metallopeptidase, partial [Escherichia coli]|nr:M48 family metallopeptidase [Escherichia coli]